MRIVRIAGLGCIGLPRAVTLARKGCEVIAVDLHARKIHHSGIDHENIAEQAGLSSICVMLRVELRPRT